MRISDFLASIALLVACVAASHAWGDTLDPGETEFPVATTLTAPDNEIDSITALFSALPPYSGSLTSKVYLDDDSPLDGYTFTYELSNDITSLDAIHRLTVNNFSGYTVEAYYLVPTLNQEPGFVTRSLAGTIGFSFYDFPLGEGQLNPGLTSALLILHTDAQTYSETIASVIDCLTSEVPSFAPGPVPEPGTIVLLATGAVTLAAVAWRRRRSR
jgi:hypothetical protein